MLLRIRSLSLSPSVILMQYAFWSINYYTTIYTALAFSKRDSQKTHNWKIENLIRYAFMVQALVWFNENFSYTLLYVMASLLARMSFGHRVCI